MGEVDSDVNAQSALTNPAVLPWLYDYSELSLQHLVYFSDVNYSQAAYTRPVTAHAAMNLVFGYLGTGSITRTVADSSIEGYAEQGNFTASDMMLGIGFGQRVSGQFSYGVGAKVVRESIDSHNSTGVMMSLAGFYYPLGRVYRPLEDEWQVGFGVFNIGPGVGDYALPIGGFLGIGKRLSQPLFFGLEMVGYTDEAMEGRVGLEYDINDIFFLRGGYRYPFKDQEWGDSAMAGLSGGIGFRVQQLLFDYAWVPYGDLGQTHRLSLSVRLGGSPATDEREQMSRKKRKKWW